MPVVDAAPYDDVGVGVVPETGARARGASIPAPRRRRSLVIPTPPYAGPRSWGADGYLRAVLVAGTLLALLGIVEMVAWQQHWGGILRIRAEYTSVKFNIAFALAVTGAAFVGAVRRRYRWLRAAGAFDLALGALTLAEEAFGLDLRVDQAVMADYLSDPGQQSGRMTSNAAGCLVVVGIAVLVWRPEAERGRGRALTLAAVLTTGVALAALLSYLVGTHGAAGWHTHARMALPTTLALGLVALCLLGLEGLAKAWSGRAPTQWVAVPAGVSLFMLVLVVWQAVVGARSNGAVPAVPAAGAVLVIAILTGSMLALAVRHGQRAHSRREVAETLAVQLSEEVSRRIRAEGAARESEQMVSRVLEALPVGVAIFTPDGRMQFVNRIASALSGRAFDGPVGEEAELSAARGLYVAGTDQLYPTEGSALDRALAGEASYADDLEIRRPDGTVVPIEHWGAAVRTETGEISFAVVVAADITWRRASERLVLQQAALLEHVRDAIFTTDGERYVTSWNHAAEALYGWTRAEAMGRVSGDLLRTEFPQGRLVIEAALLWPGHWEGELVNYTKGGRRLVLATRLAARLGPDGSLDSMMVIDTDITDRKTAEAEQARHAAELVELNQQLRRSNEELEQFAYVASHDLSEPLRAISGPVSLLARRYQGRLDADADAYIGFAVDGCDRMQTLIHDLLALSRVGRQDWSDSAVDTDSALELALRALQPVIEARGARVTSDDLPEVEGDPGTLIQVLQNLVGNAIKFTAPDAEPRIHVGAVLVDGYWRFTVTDNGIGVADRHRERVFGMFKRLHGQAEYPGTGIGLALCRKIVQRHGGDIGVGDGPDGSGSTFWFTLPVRTESV